MAGGEAAAAVRGQFETVHSFISQFDFLSSVRFSQALDKLLTFLPTDDDHARAATYLPVLKLTSFVLIVSKSMDVPRILRGPRTRIVTNILKSLEMTRRIANHSFDVCSKLADQNLPQVFLPQLDLLSSYPSGWKEENICRLARSMLDFLAEINRRLPTARAEYRSADAVRIFLGLTSFQNETVRLSSTLLLSHITGEKENDYINATERHLRLILNSFPRSVGPRRLEILKGLKSLISHDRNKDFFVRNHLPLLLEEFATNHSSVWSPEEEAVVYEVLWILTFSANCREEIGECSTLMTAAKAAAKNGRSDAVKCNAKGVVWKIQESAKNSDKPPARKESKLVTDSAGSQGKAEDESDKEDEEEDEDEEEVSDEYDGSDDDVVDSVAETPSLPLTEVSDSGFVLLTFTPSSRKTFGTLQGKLKEAGYDVVSRCSLEDASIQSMACAVKEASAIVFEVSPASKCCAWFREVLEMSHRLQKTLVPLLLENAYNPDGWLGFVCGSNLIYDMYDDNCTEVNVGKIFLELNRRGKNCCSYRKPSEADKLPRSGVCGQCAFEVRHLSLVEKTSSAPSPALTHRCSAPQEPLAKRATQPGVLDWSQEQVSQWLLDLGIPDAAKDNLAASGLDGELLLTWQSLLTEAPDAFFESARQELSLGLVDTLRLTKGLRGLIGGPGGAKK